MIQFGIIFKGDYKFMDLMDLLSKIIVRRDALFLMMGLFSV